MILRLSDQLRPVVANRTSRPRWGLGMASTSPTAGVAKVPPHSSIVELVANNFGDRHSEDEHQRDSTSAAQHNRYEVPGLVRTAHVVKFRKKSPGQLWGATRALS